jgi:hypothetical protein
VELQRHIEYFRAHPKEQEQPATLRVAVAGKNLDTMHYNVLVTYLPIKRTYEKLLDYTFVVRIEEAPPLREQESSLHQALRAKVESARLILRGRPKPNQSLIRRSLDRRRGGERADLSQSGIRRWIKRWRGW